MCSTSSYNVTKKSCQQLTDMIVCGLAADFPGIMLSGDVLEADGQKEPVLKVELPGRKLCYPYISPKAVYEQYDLFGGADEQILMLVEFDLLARLM